MQKFMIMDYSLLLIVEENPDWTSEKLLKRKKTIKGNDESTENSQHDNFFLGANLKVRSNNTIKTITQSKKLTFLICRKTCQ